MDLVRGSCFVDFGLCRPLPLLVNINRKCLGGRFGVRSVLESIQKYLDASRVDVNWCSVRRPFGSIENNASPDGTA